MASLVLHTAQKQKIKEKLKNKNRLAQKKHCRQKFVKAVDDARGAWICHCVCYWNT